MNEEQIPYDAPDLRDAFQQGWEARLNDEPRPMDLIIRVSDLGQAWLDGYNAAQKQDIED